MVPAHTAAVSVPDPARLHWFRCLLLALLSLLLFTACLKLSWPTMQAVGVSASGRSNVTLPWVFPTTGPNNRLWITLNASWLTPDRWQVVPDDHLRALIINDVPVALDSLPPGATEDYNKGFEIDLGSYLREGSNTLLFVVDNGGGEGGIGFRPILGELRWLAIGMSFLPLLLGLSRLFQLRYSQRLIIALSLIVLCSYWQITPWQTRTHDVVAMGGHLDYVVRIATEGKLPLPTEGWTFYHPPLYYLMGAATWRWAQWWNIPGTETLQALSLSLWLVFVTASAGALRMALQGRGALKLATLALACWPAGIIHSIRLGNDIALYAACGLTSWFMLRWWRRHRRTDLLGMAIGGALALLCKSNALALVAAAGLLCVVQWVRRRNASATLDLLWFSLISVTGLALSFAVRVYYYLHGQIQNWLISNADGLNGALRVPTDLKSFIPFDIPTFLTTPWMSPWEDASGRGNFWNYLLRTGLTGEFTFDDGVQRVIAYIFGALLCALLLDSLMTISRNTNHRALWRHLPWSVLACLWLASLITLRISVPFSCSNDFRYVLPVLIPALVLWASGSRFSQIALFSMALCSAVFFI